MCIRDRYIPNDNIFDISNYLNVLVANAQTLNSQSLTGNQMLVNLFSRTFTASLWLTIIFLISIITVLLDVYKRQMLSLLPAQERMITIKLSGVTTIL